MESAAWSSAIARFRLRLVRARSESAFTLIETVLAAVMLLVVATALAGVLTSSIAAHTVARERTLSEQAANDQIESIRNMDYPDVGIDCSTGTPCNPPGNVDASVPLVRDGLTATISTLVAYVGDPTPTSYATAANYKKVTVTVTRDRDSKQLAHGVTYVAPISRAPFGGIDKSIVNAQVMDYMPNAPLQGAVVTIANGPDPTRTDLSNVNGLASFAAMTPTGPTEYYDLTATLGGYETLPVDLPPAPVAHLQVAPSQTAPTSQIRVFKPGTINVRVESSPGVLYTAGTVTLQVTSATPLNGGTSTFTTTTGLVPVTLVAGQKVVPGVSYTLKALTTTPLCGTLTAPTWTNYPADATTTATIVLGACPSGSLTVNVQQLGTNAPNATVHLTGGPNNITVSPDPTTNASGNVTFSGVPSGSGYTLVASKLGQNSPSGTATVTVAGPNNASLTLPNPPLGSLTVNVQQLGTGASGATVDLSGGPYNIAVSPDPTTDASGNVTFTNVPAGSGYTLVASKLGQNSPSGSATVTVAGPNNASLTLPNPPMGSVQVTVNWLAQLVTGANVQITGGPYGINQTLTTTGTGVVTFPSVPLGGNYTFQATKSGQTTQLTNQTVAASTPVTINLPTATLTVTATWASLPAGGATVTVTGGPNSPQTYSSVLTNAVTGIATITLPTTTSNNYTVTVTKNGGSGSATVASLPAAGAPVTVALTQTKTFTITIQRAGVAAGNTAISLSITGGPNGTAGAAPAYTFSLTTNGTGVLPAVTVPLGTAGATYSIKANLTPTGGPPATCPAGSNRSGSKTALANTGANTNVTVNMTTAACPFSPLP